MRKLYKYYSDLQLIDFTNPSLKLASAHTLNDPFERIVASELLELCNLMINKDSVSYRMFHRILGEKADLENSYDTLLKLCGVVSLSETQHNLLMWAHYANQHKGICIGYDSSLLSDMKFPHFAKLPLTQKPIKVNYDNKKLFDYDYDLNFDSDNALFKSVLQKVLTTKGDDWIYEKEHRFIIPINVADRRVEFINGSRMEMDFYKNKDHRYNLKSKIKKLSYDDAMNTNYSFLLDIDPRYITDVYLGCRMHIDKAKKIREYIDSNSLTRHIKTHRFIESKKRFEIVIDESFYPRIPPTRSTL